jgi:hypothetical protein
MRGFIFLGKDKDSLVMGCHNCGANMAFGNLLKEYFSEYYTQYRLDGMVNNNIRPLQTKTKKEPNLVLHTKVQADKYIFPMEELPDTHIAKQYLNSRKLDISRFMWTPNFCNYVAEQTNNDERYIKLPKDQRIIIPLYSGDKKIVGIQGRSLDPKANMRYITIKFDEDNYPECLALSKILADAVCYSISDSTLYITMPKTIRELEEDSARQTQECVNSINYHNEG